MKLICTLLCIVFLLTSCTAAPTETLEYPSESSGPIISPMESHLAGTDEETLPTVSASVTQAPSASSSSESLKISEEEAIALLKDILGDFDEETGFEYSYGIDGTMEVDGMLFYPLHLYWLVQGDDGSITNTSFVDAYLIACNGSEILKAERTSTGITPTYPAFWVNENACIG